MKRLRNIAYKFVGITMALTIFVTTGCSSSKEDLPDSQSLAMTIGDVKVYLDELKFYAYCQQATYEATYLSSGAEIDWNAEYESGRTYTDYARMQALAAMKKRIIFNMNADDYDITLTDEDKKEIDEEVDKFLTESDQNIIEASKITKELLTRIYCENKIYEKITEKLLEGQDIDVTDEEAKQINITAVNITSEKVDSPEATMNAIYNKVIAGADLTKTSDTYGLKASTGAIGKGDMEENDLEKLCLSLKTGETGTIHLGSSYFVVHCNSDFDMEATAKVKAEMVNKKRAEIVASVYEDMQKDLDIKIEEDIWDDISFDKPILTLEDVKKAK